MIAIKAVIMAGGEGTRLRPLTCDIPKPMVPILDRPVMEYTVDLLLKYDIKDIAVTMAYLPSVITDHFGDGTKWNARLSYYIEDVPLGTGGSVKNAEDFLDSTFLVISGDALTSLDISTAVQYHKRKGAKATLVLKKEPVPLQYGVIITDPSGRIIRFMEKPSWGEVFSDTINTGIYILEPEVLDYYKRGQNFDFSRDLFPKLLRDGVPMYGYVTNDYWSDIGDITSYRQAHFDMLDRKTGLEIPATEQRKDVWIAEGAWLAEGVDIKPPVFIGKDCRIKDGCSIYSYSVIGQNCDIAERTSLKRSIVWKNTKVASDCQLRGATVCNGVIIKTRVNLFENSVIGSRSVLESGATVKPDIKIWPDKKIEQDTVLNQNLVWGTRGSKSLFGYRDISGDMDTDITPEFATRFGSAFASVVGQDGVVVVSSDGSAASRLIKNSLICGIASAGTNVIDIRDTALPVNRFAITEFKARGGIHVRMNCLQPDRAHISVSGKNGACITRNIERKIEDLYNRGDFVRCSVDCIGSTIQVDNPAPLYYKKGAGLLTNTADIRKKSPRFVVSSGSGTVTDLAVGFYRKLGCRVDCCCSHYNPEPEQERIERAREQVINGNAEMGVVIDGSGEDLLLIDDKGRIISRERYTALIASILLDMGGIQNIIIPYTAPQVIEAMAEGKGVNIIREKSAPSSIMERVLCSDDNNDKYLYLQYVLNFDAIWGPAVIMDYLVGTGDRLSVVVDRVPEFYYSRQEVKCDWNDKGRVIRQLIEENKGKDVELFEGIKINDHRGWALMLPDAERPSFNIYTEGLSEEYAQELSVFFGQRIKDILNGRR